MYFLTTKKNFLRLFRHGIYVDVFVSEREQIGGSTAAIAHNHWHRRFVVHVHEHGLYGVCAALDNETNQRYGVVIVKCDLEINHKSKKI